MTQINQQYFLPNKATSEMKIAFVGYVSGSHGVALFPHGKNATDKYGQSQGVARQHLCGVRWNSSQFNH